MVAILGIGPSLLRNAHTDEAGFLYLAGQVLDGQRHGADFFEINPPLAIWLSIPPVLVHRGFDWSAWMAWVVMVVAITIAALVLVARMLRLIEPSASHRRGFILAAGCAALLLPRLEFSEREHLALVLVLPFVMLAAVRVVRAQVNRTDALMAGLLAGIGFSLKPHFLLTWVLLELWLLGRLGRASLRRPELWCLVVVGATYLALVLLLAPEYLSMIVQLAPHYQAYLHNSLGAVVLLAGPTLLFIAWFSLALRAVARDDDPLRDALSLAFVGFFVAAILQQKGLNYHYLAAEGAGFLLLARAWQTRPPRLTWYPSGIIVRLGFALVVLIPFLKTRGATRDLFARSRLQPGLDSSYPELLATVKELAAGEAILVLSSNMNDGWPLTLDAGSRWASRYMHLWPMAASYHDVILARPQGVVRARPYPARTEFERRFSDELIADLERYQPRLLVVVLPDSTEIYGGHARRFDYLEYFGSDPRFREILGRYREVSRIGIYKVLLRFSTVSGLSGDGADPEAARATARTDKPNRKGRGRTPVRRSFSVRKTRNRKLLSARGGTGRCFNSRRAMSGLRLR
ncbi:MAG TPA: hypothetical protein VGC81_16710 [Candidatus Methylomirabilis sp.]